MKKNQTIEPSAQELQAMVIRTVIAVIKSQNPHPDDVLACYTQSTPSTKERKSRYWGENCFYEYDFTHKGVRYQGKIGLDVYLKPISLEQRQPVIRDMYLGER